MSRFTRIALILVLLISLTSLTAAYDSSDNHWNTCTDETALWGGAVRCVYIEYVPTEDSDIEIAAECVKVYAPPKFRHVCTFTPVLIVSTE